MRLPHILRPAARREFDEAIDWYEQRSSGLGAKFIEQVQRVLERISDQPQSYAVVHRDIREALVRRFPYAVYFRTEVAQVVVLAVIHTARNQSVWQSRS